MRRPFGDRPRLQAVERGHHAGGIAVEAVVDHGHAVGGLLHAASAHDADVAEFCRQRRLIEAGGMDRGQRRQRILQAMRRAGRQAEFDLLAADIRPTTFQLSPLREHGSSRAPRTPSPKRMILPFHSGASTSAGSTSTPSFGKPCAMLTFSRRIASRLPSFSRCTGCTFTTSATVGRVRFAQPRDFAGLVHAHFDHPQRRHAGRHCTASAARPRNC